ncbi:adenylosuccinate lyase [Methermicoccus shengliensis]|uniref:Adenylosuccinate lyase n=1 Tax=Methermicoccus shengliensis TaxID=660064 RepID=A0A832VYZ3_9EURY|nr:adenylosuccinate lyase [Methermicoccus shengliensis]KUK04644.1 MAG: Adenylosuccinate lyase [Euryarchaeota archaeon 55_53]KUK30771.1 MAG: Adenylosuccinate lyase [Methanosarcinales archeaon 56_1174]MDI3487962.1 adenylosuccinate lyase [Methanosarcinales archaeon]MDN5295100.1 adenylosuccinate lyase [Methanosarcinales archaeon]HIH69124.1 adenylosuccinate lyase [Methermicoccus shengliensis]
MAIHPIEYRYGHPQMKAVWSEEARLRYVLRVEAALALAEAEVGIIPKEAAAAISEGIEKVRLERVKEIEEEIQHDMMAVVLALSEQCGEAGGYVHYGATSNDILDTATALQLKDACSILDEQLRVLLGVLLERAQEHIHTVCAGRTHGQIGVPTTYGLRFAVWAHEVYRHIERLRELKKRLLVGKLGGAVGTGAALGRHGLEVRRKMCELLGLGEVLVCTQVIQRDRHAEFVMWMANVATTLDKIGTEIRTLQRTEIAEVHEAFGERQVGSSTMPHKRNPIKSEQMCGLARIVRSFVEPELLNNTLWDERDLTNSAPERIIFPEATVLTDHIIRLCIRIMRGLVFDMENIERNVSVHGGVNLAESVMMLLAKKGMGRQDAHELVRGCAMRAYAGEGDFLELLKDSVGGLVSEQELKEALDPHQYIGTAVEQVERVIALLKPEAVFE